jgi:hypothetical protein
MTLDRAWRYVGASVRGTSHVATGLPCQDASIILPLAETDGAPVLALVAADGAGSAEASAIGAQLVCETWLGRLRTFLDSPESRVADITEGLVRDWFFDAAEAVRTQAAATGRRPRDFACTFLAVVLGPTSGVFVQLGDGAIVRATGADAWTPVFWPQAGEYANTTYFVTDEGSHDRLLVTCEATPPGEVALFTDGLQALALHYATQSAHAPFFAGFFRTLREASAGEADALHDLLVWFLESERVCKRTDDDKTLLLATRLPPMAPASVVSASPGPPASAGDESAVHESAVPASAVDRSATGTTEPQRTDTSTAP